MTRSFFLLLLALLPMLSHAGAVTLEVDAPQHAGKRIFLERVLDLFTLRTTALGEAMLDEAGRAVLHAELEGTCRAVLRVEDERAELYLRPGRYQVVLLTPEPGTARSVAGNRKVPLEFLGLDPLEVNMLTTDLYERLDAYTAEAFLSGDDSLSAQGQVRRRVSATTASKAATDTFCMKMTRFYADVPDPWFQEELRYGLAGLQLGPTANDRNIHERYLKERPVLYDIPEYVRFVRTFHHGRLMALYRSHGTEVRRAMANADVERLKALLSTNDSLKEEPRLNELVLMMGLHADHRQPEMDRAGGLAVLTELAQRSTYPEHRGIAANMVWDLTAMWPGARLPSLRLTNAAGDRVDVDSLLSGPVLLAVTSARCTSCEREISALEALYGEFGSAVRFVVVVMEEDDALFARYVAARPARKWTWLRAGNDRSVLETLRARSIPVFLLLEDGVLTHAPAPNPSAGLAALLHPHLVKAREKGTLKPHRAPPPPKR